LGHVAPDLVDLLSKLLLALGFFVEFDLEFIELGLELWLRCRVTSATLILLAAHFVPHRVDLMLPSDVILGQLAR